MRSFVCASVVWIISLLIVWMTCGEALAFKTFRLAGCTPESGGYQIQFTLRIGGAPGCPKTPCEVVYHSGASSSEGIDDITVP